MIMLYSILVMDAEKNCLQKVLDSWFSDIKFSSIDFGMNFMISDNFGQGVDYKINMNNAL